MAALREVTLTLPEVRAHDFIVFHEGTYKLEEWHVTLDVHRETFLNRHTLKASNNCYAKLQKINLDDDYERVGSPIFITVGRADALKVLVPTEP